MTFIFGNSQGTLEYTNVDQINDTVGEFIILRNDTDLMQIYVNGCVVGRSRVIFVDREIFNKNVVTVNRRKHE